MKQLPRALAVVLLIAIYAFTLPSSISDQEKNTLASDFSFKKSILYKPVGVKARTERIIHPQYKKLAAWISSVGAAVTFTDLDGDHLPNDIIQVDPRYDKVLVSPAPGTGNRFQPFELIPCQLPYNTKTMAPQGTLANDFNEDGRMDILVYYWNRTPIIFYQQADKTFIESELNPTQEKWFCNSGTIADFDGDGHPDIFIGTYFPDNSKMLEDSATDRDQVMQHSMSRGDNGGANRIFLWSGMEGGKAVYKEDKSWLNNLPYPNDWTLAVAAADINGDMLPELYIANDFGPDKFLYNTSTPGHLSFRELTGKKVFNNFSSSAIGKDSFKGMGVDFGDLNGDGLLDIFVSNLTAEYGLLESHFAFINTGKLNGMAGGEAPYVNKSEQLGLSRSSWSWEAKLTDFNNDGVTEAIQATGFLKGTVNCWPELQELATANDEALTHPEAWPALKPGVADLSGNSHIPLFVRSKSGKYYDLAANIGIDENQITRGIAISDIDHDGRLDFASADQWEDSKLYYNQGTTKNLFLGLSLMFPVQPNATSDIVVDSLLPARYAIGAVAKIKLPDGRKLTGFVDGGNGHSGKNSSEIHFGLGQVDPKQPLDVELTWRKRDGKIASSLVKVKPGWHTINLPY
ncbi:MAG: CRTAC1 family protein [Williamsia sp.]|nr:CRTAC1 family protein [Williamsia sp.]